MPHRTNVTESLQNTRDAAVHCIHIRSPPAFTYLVTYLLMGLLVVTVAGHGL